MNLDRLTRLRTHLTILTLTTLSLTSLSACQADEPVRADARMYAMLFPPISQLVPSPYIDPRGIENPLRVEVKVASKNHALESVMSQVKPSKTDRSIVESFEADEQQKIKLSQDKDYTLIAPSTISQSSDRSPRNRW